MRWFLRAAVASSVLACTVAAAVEPDVRVVRNPYTVGPTMAVTPPQPASVASPLNAWRGTVQPASSAESAAGVVETSPSARALPKDCLKALRAAVQVRSPAEAYRAQESTTADKTAARTDSQGNLAPMRRDEAVKPASWIEDALPSAAAATPVANAPRLLSDVTAEYQGATRLTRNPYRNGDATENRSTTTVADTAANPLR